MTIAQSVPSHCTESSNATVLVEDEDRKHRLAFQDLFGRHLRQRRFGRRDRLIQPPKDRPMNNCRDCVACSHDAKRRVSMEAAMTLSMPTLGCAE